MHFTATSLNRVSLLCPSGDAIYHTINMANIRAVDWALYISQHHYIQSFMIPQQNPGSKASSAEECLRFDKTIVVFCTYFDTLDVDCYSILIYR